MLFVLNDCLIMWLQIASWSMFRSDEVAGNK